MADDTARSLNFKDVDDLSFAFENQSFDKTRIGEPYIANNIGPLLELYQQARSSFEPISLRGEWLDVKHFPGLGKALADKHPRWVANNDRSLGLLKTNSAATDDDWVSFAVDAKRAATMAGLSSDWSAQMVAAIGEFHSNIIEHSAAQETGFVAFEASSGKFEFVASDLGLGLLATLRQSQDYQTIKSHNEALRSAITDGCSRFGANKGRGHGFRPLFVGLSNRHADIRFRSGDACCTINGMAASATESRFSKKANIKGFFVSIECKNIRP